MRIKPEDIIYNDLSENHKGFARTIGIDALLELSKEYGGTQIYIPKPEELRKNTIYRLIKEDYIKSNDISLCSLAKKYNVSESTVYRIVRSIINTNK